MTERIDTQRDVEMALHRLVRVVEEQWADHTGDYDFFADHLDIRNRAERIVASVREAEPASLSSLVDLLAARREWVQAHGNPDEAQMLNVVLNAVSAYAQREERLLRAIEQVEQRVKEAS